MSQGADNLFDVFFSHSHHHAEIVEHIARKLQDGFRFNIWLDKWVLVPGEPFRQAISRGIDDALTCAVFVGSDTPRGWFEEEIGKALNKQSKISSFRVIGYTADIDHLIPAECDH